MAPTTNITPISRTSVKAPRSGASMGSKRVGERGLEQGVGGRDANVPEVFGGPAEPQFRRATVGGIRGNRHDREIVLAVGQRKPEAEGAVGAQFDFVPAQRDFGAGLGGAVNDQFGIHVEPKTLGLPRLAAL